MKVRKRQAAVSVLLAALLLLSACGDDDVIGPDGNGNGNGPVDQGPLNVFDIFLRPFSIQRAPDAGDTPNPQLAVHYLTAFFQGGEPGATFTWSVPPELGSVEPKSDDLSVNDAAVVLLNDGKTPLGFYDISVEARSGNETSSFTKRFAVVQNTWMKHERARISNPTEPPDNLVLHSTWAPKPGSADEIYFVASPSAGTVNIWSINAHASLAAGEQDPRTPVFRAPDNVDPVQATTAIELSPDFSPAALGRNEILFSSQLDINWSERQNTTKLRIPFNLWVVKRPAGIVEFPAKVVTFDSLVRGIGNTLVFKAVDFMHPRWDPSAQEGDSATIAFIAKLDDSGENVWLADLVDENMDTFSDTLVNYRRLTNMGGVSDYGWHPNGQEIYFASGSDGIHRVDLGSGAVETISFAAQDSFLADFTSLSVFQGETTLVAFQATSENRVHLYVYDVDNGTLTRILPFSFPITHNLFPRWHPTRKEILYVSDYSVARWSDNPDPAPTGNPDFEGLRRTQWPSLWSVLLEE